MSSINKAIMTNTKNDDEDGDGHNHKGSRVSGIDDFDEGGMIGELICDGAFNINEYDYLC